MEKKMNWLALSGFMIGPILGSGIILLPPMIYSKIGAAAIYGWAIILLLGALFAMIFANLATKYPGEGGMAIAVEQAFGTTGKLTSAFSLISAVLFGPIAVLLTASEYLHALPFLNRYPTELIGLVLIGLMYLILMNRVDIVSKIILTVSSIITIILIVSSLNVLITKGPIVASPNQITPDAFGQSLLLLFWAIIGWEIIGNYSEEVIDKKTTILKGAVFSLTVITITYLLVAIAVQSLDIQNLTMTDLLFPLFGESAKWLLAILVSGLCFSTVLTIVGAVGRLVHSLAEEKHLPGIFLGKNKSGSPSKAIGGLVLVHLTVLTISWIGIVDIELLVTIANGFFILNAIMGLAASYRLLEGLFLKASAIVLILAFAVLLLFLEPISYLGYAALGLWVLYLVRSGSVICPTK